MKITYDNKSYSLIEIYPFEVFDLRQQWSLYNTLNSYVDQSLKHLCLTDHNLDESTDTEECVVLK